MWSDLIGQLIDEDKCIQVKLSDIFMSSDPDGTGIKLNIIDSDIDEVYSINIGSNDELISFAQGIAEYILYLSEKYEHKPQILN